MPSKKSTLSARFGVLPFLSICALSNRVDQETTSETVKAVVVDNSTQNPEMEDITGFVEYFYSRPGLMRCCCEASFPEGTSWYSFGAQREATQCSVHFSECNDVHAAAELYHYTEVGGRCIVPMSQTEDLAKLVFSRMGGSPPTYCKAIGSSNADDQRWWREMRPQGHPGVHFVRPARHGQTVSVHCEDEGYNPEHLQSSCEYVEVSYGLFDPTPACTPQPGWCEGVQSDTGRIRTQDQVIITASGRAGWICEQRGGTFSVCHANSAPRTSGLTEAEFQKVAGPSVPTAARGERTVVECPTGYEPKERVVCGRDHTFDPEPECEKVADWCRGLDVRRAHVEPLGYGEPGLVTCPPGFRPNVEFVWCDADRELSTIPECEMVPDYCPEIDESHPHGSPHMHVEARGVHQSSRVECVLGYVLADGVSDTICGEDGNFHPTPQCVKDPYFCMLIVQGEQGEFGGYSVRSAGINEESAVQCDSGYLPEIANVTCGEDRAFAPEPVCPKDPAHCAPVGVDEIGASITQELAFDYTWEQHSQKPIDDELDGRQRAADPPVDYHYFFAGLVVSTAGGLPLDFTQGAASYNLREQDFPLAVSHKAGHVLQAAAIGELRIVECGNPDFGPKDASVECTVSGHFDPEPDCRLECSVLPTQLAGGCSPHEHTGACYTQVGDASHWSCWGPGVEQDDTTCRSVGYRGACWYADYSNTVASCSEKGYDGQCGSDVEYWGACFVEGASSAEPGAWACIEDPENAESESRMVPLDHYINGRCRVLALPSDVQYSLGKETYDNVCTFP